MSTPATDTPIPYLTGAQIRARFIEFFAQRGHTVVPSASLVPAGDQTLLFTNSGMVQFKDALTGMEKRDYVRVVDYQRCLRVAGKHNDFEEVGRTPRHHTLFEMLGNWSFGDYFKREAILWAWEFLTRDLGIPGERLAATVYTTDDVAHAVWKDEIGLPPERLVRWGDFPAGDEKNWWRMADVGPCGPCSELHYDRGAHLSEGPECVPDHSEHCPRWLEIWNLVFMEFELHADRSLTPLPAPGVDTGMGLERIASVVQGVSSNYDTDLFAPIHARMRELLGHDPEGFEQERFSYQVIADHTRAITFLVADGVLPSNEGRGYVLRRILRRAVRHGRLLGRREPFLGETASVVVEIMWVDFSLVAFDQLVNQAANVRYISAGRLTAPLTVRTQQGILPGSCAQHSQSLEALFAHVPGLRVAMPADPGQAYALLLASIACDDPAIVIEHRAFYHTLSGEVALDAPIEPVGGARVVREGRHATLVAFGPMVHVGLEAADQLGREGIEVEVIDPRWIAPFDTATVVASVGRTGRLVIAHQANVTGGFGAEIAARVGREAFWSLDAPIERVGVPDTRIPAAPVLQEALLPGADDIAAAVRRTLNP